MKVRFGQPLRCLGSIFSYVSVSLRGKPVTSAKLRICTISSLSLLYNPSKLWVAAEPYGSVHVCMSVVMGVTREKEMM